MKDLRENWYTGYGCSGPESANDTDLTDTLRVLGLRPLAGVIPGCDISVTPCLAPKNQRISPAVKRGDRMTV